MKERPALKKDVSHLLLLNQQRVKPGRAGRVRGHSLFCMGSLDQ